MDLTPKQQTSEAVRQAETILITTGQHPSIDQVAGVLSLAAILRKFGKKVSAIISDPLPQQLAFLGNSGLDQSLSGQRDFILKVNAKKTEVDKLRYEVEEGILNIYITPFQGGFAPSDVTFDYGDFHYDLAIVLGVPTRNRIDRVFEANQALFDALPVVNLDFHRSNESYGAINLIDGTASSLCEILVALSESLQTGLIDADIATIMLTGLMASTDRFTATHTTSKSLTVAAQMMAAGARQQDVVKALFRDGAVARSERSDRPSDRPKGGDQPRAQVDPVKQPVTPKVADPKPIIANPEADLVDAPGAESDDVMPIPAEEPIIAPAHIELSDPDSDDAPIENEFAETADPESAPAPMADFTAAAEILAQRQNEPDETTPIADQA